MYPTAYTLTVLVLTLLQYSFDKRYAKNACQGEGNDNSTLICQQNRKEIRQLSRQEFENFVHVFNEYSTRNDTDELNANINELGVVQIFDELLQSKKMLTPYWDYRLELNAEKPETSALWDAPQFDTVNQASDAQWLIEFIENENNVEDDEFFDDDPFSKLWKKRREALKVMRTLKKTDVFWHLLLLVSIETGVDQSELQVNRSSCFRDFGKFTRWVDEKCTVTLRDGEPCKSSGDCFNRRCSKNQCASTKRPNAFKPTTTKLPDIEKEMIVEEIEPISTTKNIEKEEMIVEEKLTVDQKEQNETEADALGDFPTTTSTNIDIPFEATDLPNEIFMPTQEISTTLPSTTQNYKLNLKPPKDHYDHNNSLIDIAVPNKTEWAQKIAVTTEFLANELSTTPLPPTHKHRRKGKKKKKHGKKDRLTTTTVAPHDQIPATSSYIDPTFPSINNSTNEENNSPIEQENYGSDTLDALLVYLPTPKVPTMISWTSKMPIQMAYFSFTIIEGSLGKQRKLKENGHQRAKGARIYLRGLGMPSGYTQVTQGRQMKNGIGALARTLNPNDNEPFVEFKMRVENRYGTPCKQMCLDSHQRYRRCARRTVRLSPIKKFSDPIPYFETENQATNGQYTGKGYYRKKKLTYLLFKCE